MSSGIILLFSVVTYVAAFSEDERFLDKVQDSLGEVFNKYVTKWNEAKDEEDKDINIVSREKRTGAFPKIKRKRKKSEPVRIWLEY